MVKGYVLYNLNAGNNTSIDEIKKLISVFNENLEFLNITEIKNYADFFRNIASDDFIVLCGGDGTINRFVNDTDGFDFTNKILYYPIGTGNDFATDVGHIKGDIPFEITQYIENLPTVTVKGKSYKFINGVGYGIDGYCCEVGDEQKKKSDKKVNYTSIAIKGLLFHYKPTNATVTVDGTVRTYNKVWIAPTMFGRYYGGGMIPTPNQDRKNKDGKLSLMLMYGAGKLKTLLVFPSIFKGEHIKNTKMVDVLSGHEIKVEFDRPTSLQIDGETILNVTSYTASSSVNAKKKELASVTK